MTNGSDNGKHAGPASDPIGSPDADGDAIHSGPTVLPWEDIETGKAGQLGLPGLAPVPTLGERAFLLLARQWHTKIQTIDRDKAPPRSLDILALACLLLSVEWGRGFTNVARDQMDINNEASEARGAFPWIDQISWQLCQSSLGTTPSESAAVKKLTANLVHHDSSIRCWMLEIGWITRSWLDPSKAIPLLLKNLADTLAGPFMSAGLAAAIIAKEDEEFCEMAQDFYPPSAYQKQYQDRIKYIKENGLLSIQVPFWMLETQCWRVISNAAFGQRMGALP